MNLKFQAQLAQSMAHLIAQATQHLPIGYSFIPFNLLVEVLRAEHENSNITVKVLFANLPYSVMGIRYHYNRLIDDGFIALVSSLLDARVKYVRPTDKLKLQFEALTSTMDMALMSGVFCYENLPPPLTCPP